MDIADVMEVCYGHGQGKPGALSSEERAELSRLRKRVCQLEIERDLLRNAAVFFAKEMK